MCTLVIARRPGDDWPLLIAANRDEMVDRPWQAPARHWPDRAEIVAGRDTLAGGSWLGVNDAGVVAAILNRTGSLGPAADKRSRGELVLDALDHADAREAVVALARLDGRAWRSFNLVIADNRDAYWVRGTGEEKVTAKAIPPGIHMLTSRDLDDTESPRIRNFLERFRSTGLPNIGDGDWLAWRSLLASRVHEVEDGPREAMCVVTDFGYGTVSSSLIALPSIEQFGKKPVWQFAAGQPGEAPFEAVSL